MSSARPAIRTSQCCPPGKQPIAIRQCASRASRSAAAADGYARVTRKASLIVDSPGSGLTNAATGVANAALDAIPMVVIAGDVPAHYLANIHQEVDLHLDGGQFEIFRPFVKRAWR
jgi:acetolactate synthase-1/2/3 large subunit